MEENQLQANEDFRNKLRAEIEKHNVLLDELIQLKENYKLTLTKFQELTAENDQEVVDVKKLNDQIVQKQAIINSKVKVVVEAKKVSEVEMDKNIKYTKANAALRAKLEFIESKYDYSSQAKMLSISDFKDIISSNLNVNQTIDGFAGKLEKVQKEIQGLETMSQMM